MDSELASDHVNSIAEGVLIDKSTAMFADYDMSSAPVTKMQSSATMSRAETKLDAAGRLLKQAAVALQHQKLLGVLSTRQRPQPRAAAAGHAAAKPHLNPR